MRTTASARAAPACAAASSAAIPARVPATAYCRPATLWLTTSKNSPDASATWATKAAASAGGGAILCGRSAAIA